MIEASRDFVCVRPQTYENEAETKVLKYVFSGGGVLRNTSFALMDPNGEKLTRGARSPKMTYRTEERFAEALVSTAEKYEKKAKPITALPTVRDLRLALNVAAADMRPLVVVRGANEKKTAALVKTVAKLAWSDELVGTCHYVVLDEETTFEGLTPKVGVSIVAPDPYGLGGEVALHVPERTSESKLREAWIDAVAEYEVETREHREHVREARRKDITWESELPVTDPGSRRR